MEKIIKQNIIDNIYKQYNFIYDKETISSLYNIIFDSIKNELLKENNIEIRHFGTFKIQTRKTRTGRNPKTGELITIDEHKTVVFKPGKELKVNLKN